VLACVYIYVDDGYVCVCISILIYIYIYVHTDAVGFLVIFSLGVPSHPQCSKTFRAPSMNVRAIKVPEVISQCFMLEQTNRFNRIDSKRSASGGNKLGRISHGRPLRFAHFGDGLEYMQFIDQFSWKSLGLEHVPRNEQVSDESSLDVQEDLDEEHLPGEGDIFLSDDEDDMQLESRSMEDILGVFGVSTAPSQIPLLVLPLPLVLLIMQRKWCTILLLVSWHRYLVDQNANLPFLTKPIFEGLDWPPQGSTPWLKCGAMLPKTAWVDVPEMNSEDYSYFDWVAKEGNMYMIVCIL
jgi:hypothetical protein